MGDNQRHALHEANSLYHRLTQVLRLCVADRFDGNSAPHGLLNLILNAAQSPDLASAEALLNERRAVVTELFNDLIGAPEL